MVSSRRVFLVRSGKAIGLIAASGGLGAFLDACSNSAAPKTTTTTAGATTTAKTARSRATVQLASVADVENAGEFIADTKGYFAHEGITITLLPGGPTTTVEPLVLDDKCLVGLSEADTAARAILQGNKLKVIAATLQTTPLGVMSLASKPILTPQDLYGKLLGIQSFQVSVFDAFVALLGLDISSYQARDRRR